MTVTSVGEIAVTKRNRGEEQRGMASSDCTTAL